MDLETQKHGYTRVGCTQHAQHTQHAVWILLVPHLAAHCPGCPAVAHPATCSKTERTETEAAQALDRVAHLVRRYIDAAGEDGILRRKLSQKIAGRDREFLNPALERLVNEGEVAAEKLPRSRRYRLSEATSRG